LHEFFDSLARTAKSKVKSQNRVRLIHVMRVVGICQLLLFKDINPWRAR